MDTMEGGHGEKSSTHVSGICETVQRSGQIKQLSTINNLLFIRTYFPIISGLSESK